MSKKLEGKIARSGGLAGGLLRLMGLDQWR